MALVTASVPRRETGSCKYVCQVSMNAGSTPAARVTASRSRRQTIALLFCRSHPLYPHKPLQSPILVWSLVLRRKLQGNWSRITGEGARARSRSNRELSPSRPNLRIPRWRRMRKLFDSFCQDSPTSGEPCSISRRSLSSIATGSTRDLSYFFFGNGEKIS